MEYYSQAYIKHNFCAKPLASYILVWILLSLATLLHANNRADSLSFALENANTDIARLGILNELSKHLLDIDPKQAERYTLDALNIANRAQNPSEKAVALLNMGQLQYNYNNYETSMQYYEHSLALARENDLPEIEIEALYKIAVSYYHEKRYEPSEKYFHQSLERAKEVGNKEYCAANCYWLAQLYAAQNELKKVDFYAKECLNYYKTIGKHKKRAGALYNSIGYVFSHFSAEHALEYYLKGLEISPNDGHLFYNVGNTYLDMAEYALALTYIEKSLEVSQNTLNNKQLKYFNCFVYGGLGNAYLGLKKYAKAETAFQQSIEIAKDLSPHDQHGLNETYMGFGQLREYQERYEDALVFYQKVILLAGQTNAHAEEAEANLYIGKLYKNKFNDFEQSISYLERALQLSKKYKDVRSQQIAYEELHHIYEGWSEEGKALALYKQSVAMRDSLQNVKFKQNLDALTADFKVKAEVAEKDRQIAENRSERRLILIVLGVIVILSLLFFLWLNTQNRAKLAVKNKELATKNTELKDMNQALIVADQMKDNFISSINHQIRTPMLSIVGSAALLHQKIPENLKSTVNDIEYAGDHLMRLLQNVLVLSELRQSGVQLVKEDFNLDRLLQQLLEQYLKTTDPTKVLMLYSTEGETLSRTLQGDRSRLYQLLSCLLDNAVKFTEAGEIVLKTKIRLLEQDIAEVYFEVSDTGAGIAEAKLPFIFEQFSEILDAKEQQFADSGLGLAIAKKIARLHDAKLQVESRVNEGSRFFFSFQYALGASLVKEHLKNSKMPSTLVGKRALVVEDNLMNQRMIVKLLELQAMNVLTANDGAIAIEYAKNQDFDLVLMDLNMPVMDGFEATKRIRQLPGDKATIPIIAVSAIVETEIRTQLKEIGITAYIGKPFKPGELVELLTQTLS